MHVGGVVVNGVIVVAGAQLNVWRLQDETIITIGSVIALGALTCNLLLVVLLLQLGTR